MDELAKRFAELAAQYGPSVIDAAKGAAQVEGYSTLASGALQLVVSVVILTGAHWVWDQETSDNDIKMLKRVVAIGIGVIGAVFMLASIWNWIDPWTWVAINHPELWLAKKAMHI